MWCRSALRIRSSTVLYTLLLAFLPHCSHLAHSRIPFTSRMTAQRRCCCLCGGVALLRPAGDLGAHSFLTASLRLPSPRTSKPITATSLAIIGNASQRVKAAARRILQFCACSSLVPAPHAVVLPALRVVEGRAAFPDVALSSDCFLREERSLAGLNFRRR